MRLLLALLLVVSAAAADFTEADGNSLAPAPEPSLFNDMFAPAPAHMPFIDTSAAPPVVAPAPLPPLPPPPPPPSPAPPPPPPVGTRVNLVLRLADAPSPMAADLATRVASTMSILTPTTPWIFFTQQPSYPNKLPEVPRMEAPAPSTAPTLPSSPEGQAKVSVDPLAINGLGRKLRQDASTAPHLKSSARGQCYTVKHVLAPDKATCTAWCKGQMADGKVDAAEYKPRFYIRNGNMCCSCAKKADSSATNTTTTTGAAAPAAATPADNNSTGEVTTAPSPSPTPSSTPLPPVALAPAPAPAPSPIQLDEGADGVYLFAYTMVMTEAEEEGLNATLFAAATSGKLLDSLKTTAGVSAAGADIVFLGSGKYQFAALPPRYVRPVYIPTPSAPTPPTSSSSSNGVMIGIILGSVVAAVLLVIAVSVFCVHRRRHQKQATTGQGLVREWESERKQAEDERARQIEERRAASQAANDRYWAKQQSQRARSQKLEQLRSKFGLGRKDHLAAAAGRMEAAEAAEAAASAAAGMEKKGEPSGKPASSSRGSTQQASVPTISLEAHMPTAASTEGQALSSSVVVRSSFGPAPSWATRDAGAAPKSSTFGRWFGRD